MVGTPWQCKYVFDIFNSAGWTFTIWAGLMMLTGLLIILVAWKGEEWRKKAEAREALARGN